MRARAVRLSLLAAVVAAGCPKDPPPRQDGGPDGGGRDTASPDGRDGRLDSAEAGGVGGTLPDAAGVFAEGVMTWWAKPNRKLDVLFMVDNSSGMERAQATFRAGLPAFVNTLKTQPDGLPDLHLGVVTSDLGIGHTDVAGCNAMGERGVLRRPPAAGTCAATALAAGATYLSSSGGATPQTNFSGDIAAALQCLVQVGASGCNFERQLGAVLRALGADGASPPAENQGFLRADALLALVLLSNADDCSAAQDGLYTVGDTTLASTLGPITKFRCAEFGHLCNGQPPARRAPNGVVTDTINYDTCMSSEEAGRLIPVATVATALRALKASPESEIVVASIQGPAAPYQVHWKAPLLSDTGPWPELSHSCTATDGSFADPGVRLQQLARAFGSNGASYSICDADYGPTLQAIARRILQMGGRGCFAAVLVDKDGNGGNGVQADCTVFDRVPNGTGGVENRPLPACDANGNTPPCWRAVPASSAPVTCPAGNSQIVVDRGTTAVPDNTITQARCALCIPGMPNPTLGCP
jgi:hypothetical protein